MATLRQRLNRKNAAGGYDAVYLETSSDLVLRPDGTTVEFALANVKTEVNNIVQAGVAPTSHAAEHATGGKDPITPASIGAAAAEHSHTGFAASDHTHNYAGAGTPGGAATTAVKLQTKRTLKVNLASTTAVEFDGSSNVTPGVSGILPAANGGTGNGNGTVAKLSTARTIKVNLGSTAAASFDGSANVTPGISGVLPVANGGTGASSLDSLKSAIGIGSPTVTAPTYPASVPAVGNTMSWAGKTWRVVHKLSGVAILALERWEKDVKFAQDSVNYTNGYIGSHIFNECTTFANSLKLFACDYLISFGGLPCFVPGADQVAGDFTYFATQSNRIFRDSSGNAKVWWTCTPSENSGSYSYAYYVNTDGTIHGGNYYSNNVTTSCGFRPCVAIRL